MELTGNLGDVMKESIKIGGTYARYTVFRSVHHDHDQGVPGEAAS